MTFCSNQPNGRCGRQRVDRGRRFARVDRAAHHGQRLGPPSDSCRRSSARSRRRPGLPAGTPRACAAARRSRSPISLEELDQIIDVIVEIERAVAERHQLRVAPVGDVDVVAAAAAARPFRAAASHSGPTSARRSAAAALRRRPSRTKCLSCPNGLRRTISSWTATSLRPIVVWVEAEFGLAARRCRHGRKRRGWPRPAGPSKRKHRDLLDYSATRAHARQVCSRLQETSAELHRRRRACTGTSSPPDQQMWTPFAPPARAMLRCTRCGAAIEGQAHRC